MIIELLILILGIPVGLLISWYSRDELISGRKWFKILIIFSTILGIWGLLIKFDYISWTAGFMIIISFTALIKSRNPKWTKI